MCAGRCGSWSPMSKAAVAAVPRLFLRQRTVLSLLRAFGGKAEEDDFQGFLFDFSRRCRERGVDAPYDFVFLPEGPRSFTALADRDKLARRGILVPGSWNLTAKGRRIAAQFKNRDVAIFAARVLHGNGHAIACGGHESARASHDDDANQGTECGLLATIGYEGQSYEAYFNKLLRHGISRLCDVRRNPLSRKWGFSKRLLAQGCEELGIRYEPFPELGIDSGRRAGLTGRAAYDRLFSRYESTTLPECRETVANIARWIEAGEHVALTCFERDPQDCHRSRLATAIVKAAATPLQPRHL